MRFLDELGDLRKWERLLVRANQICQKPDCHRIITKQDQRLLIRCVIAFQQAREKTPGFILEENIKPKTHWSEALL